MLADAAQPAEEVAAYLALYNKIRPHETLRWHRPRPCNAPIHTYLAPKSPKKADTAQLGWPPPTTREKRRPPRA
jgi:hypothetical protein